MDLIYSGREMETKKKSQIDILKLKITVSEIKRFTD